MGLRKRLKTSHYRRLVYLGFRLIGAVLAFFPRRPLFLLLVAADAGRLPARRKLYQAYLPHATSYLADHPDFRFSTDLSRRFISSSAVVLHGIGAYRELGELVDEARDCVVTRNMRQGLVRSLFELGEFEKARAAALAAPADEVSAVPDLAHHKAMLDIIAGDEESAMESLGSASRGNANMLRPHQNLAARPPSSYAPNKLDFACGNAGWLYDLCNFTGQRVTHVGRGDVGIGLYERALEAQAELCAVPPLLSPEVGGLLRRLDISFDELRIIPEEWSTQIGHLGMLDILFRMRELGWWSGKAVMVVRPELVANKTFFRLLEGIGKVVTVGETVSERVAEELLSLQRWCGLNFNAFRLPGGTVVPWQDAGALAIEQWEREGRGHPLRDAYDRFFGAPGFAPELRRLREQWGMKPDDWYVCLHTRDAGHYFELGGTGQTHRNSPIEASLDAIRYITGIGGWVVKLGGPHSARLPKMDRAIDYALGGSRSDAIDVHLIRNARAFIGTTSGLSNVAVSFGIPCAIVNAISTDAQLWHKDVRFTPKPVRLADGTTLTQRQLTSSPWRWRAFDAVVLRRHGARPENNSPDEILEAVKEVVALGSGHALELDEAAIRLIAAWKARLSLPYFYGAGRCSLYYLKKHEQDFLAEKPTGGAPA